MPKVKDICRLFADFAPLSLQESYDNSGLLIGNAETEISSLLITLDVTESVINEAISLGANCIVSHHPLIFGSLKQITGQNAVQRCVELAIRHSIAIYAAHTNVDNIIDGVNGKIADLLGVEKRKILSPFNNKLIKIVTFVPSDYADSVRNALFAAGAGQTGENYDSCSFSADGNGSFRAKQNAQPFVGKIGELHYEKEQRIEVITPDYQVNTIISALIAAHPYQEVAYDIIPLKNAWNRAGAGLIGELPYPADEKEFITELKNIFNIPVIRHSALLGKKIKRVAICGGAGSFLISNAIAQQADIFLSADFKYHDFFEADNKILLADLGHYESEVHTKEIFYDIISKNFPNFAVHLSKVKTNPINYI